LRLGLTGWIPASRRLGMVFRMSLPKQTSSVRQAVILAGGQATRLRPYTDTRPKAMIEVAGRPIIDYQLDWLAASGVRNVVVSCGYLADVLKEHLLDGSRTDLDIALVVEDEPLGRGGALKFAAAHLPAPEERWLAFNGDVLTRFSLADFCDRHERASVTATVALTQYRIPYGLAELDGQGLIRGFRETPLSPYWINAGGYCFEPSVVSALPDKGDHELTTFPELAEQGKLGSFLIEGYWRGVDTAKDLKQASAEVTQLGWTA